MALVRESIELARGRVEILLQNYREKYEQMDASWSQIQADPNFQAWVLGTDFGKTFVENYEKALEISKSYMSTGEKLLEKVNNFLNRQEEINNSGN